MMKKSIYDHTLKERNPTKKRTIEHALETQEGKFLGGITKPKPFNPVATLTIHNDISKMNVDELIRLLNWIKKCHRDIDSEPMAYGKCRFRLMPNAKIARERGKK
jgi:hypothetical protein